MMYQAILIRSGYVEKGLSDRRLALSWNTAIKSLSSQTLKPCVHIEMDRLDPNASARIEAFESTGCDVRVFWIGDNHGWGIPSGRKLLHRLDDDDMISVDFCGRSLEAAIKEAGDVAVIWPNGFVLFKDRLHPLTHNKNQFVALATDRNGWHPYLDNHHNYFVMSEWRNCIVTQDRGWCWVRHSDAWTKTRKVYLSESDVPLSALMERF